MGNGKGSGPDFGLLVLRLALGGIMMAHGITKLVGEGAPGVAGFADDLGKMGLQLPYPMAVAAISSEIGGGLLVILGLLPRLGALAIFVTMAVAAWKAHLANGFFLVFKTGADIKADSHVPHGIEYNVALAAMALCIVFTGAGKIRVPIGKKG